MRSGASVSQLRAESCRAAWRANRRSRDLASAVQVVHGRVISSLRLRMSLPERPA